MGKVICEICGTSYPESAESCPICGCSRDAAKEFTSEELELTENAEETKDIKKKDIFDFDEVNTPPVADDDDDEDDDDYDDEEEDEDETRPNTFVVIFLTILIVCLLVAAGFLFIKYFLPNMGDKAEAPASTTAAVVEEKEPTETTELTVPCERIIMNNEAKAELSHYGQQFLLNVIAVPENTTDQITYTSQDENIAVVSEDGKITAVSEGETQIIINCGKNSIPCTVVVKFVAENVPTTQAAEETLPEETKAEENADPEETVPQETAGSSAAVDPNVVLKLKKTDIQLGVYYYFTLELDCELDPTQVEWSSEHPHIAKVDDKGVVTAMQEGTTAITAKYGDQEVSCMVRCGWY